jgi:hypothetical protein
MENQENSVNLDVITADDINMDPISNTQSRDIYEVQPVFSLLSFFLGVLLVKNFIFLFGSAAGP